MQSIKCRESTAAMAACRYCLPLKHDVGTQDSSLLHSAAAAVYVTALPSCIAALPLACVSLPCCTLCIMNGDMVFANEA